MIISCDSIVDLVLDNISAACLVAEITEEIDEKEGSSFTRFGRVEPNWPMSGVKTASVRGCHDHKKIRNVEKL